MRGQGTGNKQVGDGILNEEVALKAASEMHWISHRAYNTYLELLEMGVCREQARMILPQNLYTQCYWQMDLHNLLRFIELRDHPHAQHEIRVYAQAMLQIAEDIAPVSVAAWRERVRPGG